MTLIELAARWADMEPHVPTLTALASECRVIVELGVRGGVSTWALLLGLPPNGVLVSVDIDATVPGLLPEEVRDDPRLTLIIGDDRDRLVQDRLPKADLVFIDTSHEYHHTIEELLLAKRLGSPQIVLHDWIMFPEVRDAARGFMEREGYYLERLEQSKWGLAILVPGVG